MATARVLMPFLLHDWILIILSRYYMPFSLMVLHTCKTNSSSQIHQKGQSWEHPISLIHCHEMDSNAFENHVYEVIFNFSLIFFCLLLGCYLTLRFCCLHFNWIDLALENSLFSTFFFNYLTKLSTLIEST